MGLTYHYKFRAGGDRTAAELKAFLQKVEKEAKRLGFRPTMVLDATFDTPERREFSRRLTHGLVVENAALKQGPQLEEGQVWDVDSAEGVCRLIPERGVVLVVTDEHGCETVLGFFRYPAMLAGADGREIMRTGVGQDWVFEDFLKTPDARFRTLVKKFADAGYVEEQSDDFAPARA